MSVLRTLARCKLAIYDSASVKAPSRKALGTPRRKPKDPTATASGKLHRITSGKHSPQRDNSRPEGTKQLLEHFAKINRNDAVTRRIRIAIITSIIVPYDAISSAVRQDYRDLTEDPRLEVTLFALGNAVSDLPVVVVKSAWHLLEHPDFLSSKLQIFHFGIYYTLFDALLNKSDFSKKLVVFHNVTPKELLDIKYRRVIEMSMHQAGNIIAADHVWADSEINRQVLVGIGVEESRIEVAPLAVSFPSTGASPIVRDPTSFQLVSVGRAVRSKGILEAITAVKAAFDRGHKVKYIVVGNSAFADDIYLDECQALVKEYNLQRVVSFEGTVTPPVLEKLYYTSDVLLICSYHEGFCVPVIEGLRAGCIPVGFAAGNVPVVAHGLGRLVRSGDLVSLSAALNEVLDDLSMVRSGGDQGLRLDRGVTSVEHFENLRRKAVTQYEPSVLKDNKIQTVLRLCNENDRFESTSN